VTEEENGKEDKFDFNSAGEASAYISLEQARVIAARHARENRDFYGRRYANRDMIWEDVDSEEGEDYYYVRLSYRPAGQFHGEPGVERFTIDKTGPVEHREIVRELAGPRNWTPIRVSVGALAIAGAVVGGLFAAGVIPPSPPAPPVTSVGAATPEGSVGGSSPTQELGGAVIVPPVTSTPVPTLTSVPTATPAQVAAVTPVVATPIPPLPAISAPLPDFKVELLYPPTVVECAGGPGDCNIRVDLKIDNLGESLAPGGIKYTVEAEGVPPLTLATGEGGAIAPGGSTGGFFVTMGPGSDCFNPDCTVTVTVDPDNDIAESDEANNTT